MRRRVRRCSVLVGWEDERMTVPVKCGKAVTHQHASYKLPLCAEHAKANATKGFTLVPVKEGEPMVGINKGSPLEKA